MENLKKMIITLAESNGTSGDESEILNTVKDFLPEGAVCEIDSYGNLVATLKGEGKTILLDAHADRIGMVVTSVEDGGFLHVDKCGGMDARVLAARDVTVWGRKPIHGVITSTPPHLSNEGDGKKATDIKDILIDTGLDADELNSIVSLGDRVTVNSPVCELLNDRISGPALDNRAGCAVIIKALELVSMKKNHPTVKLLFSVEEETGGDGAVTGGYNIDADECICVDVSFADAPDMPSKKCGKLGKGPMIGFSPALDYKISNRLKAVAADKGIEYQLEIMSDSTGTNADHISVSKGGIKTGLVSVPQRNMHTSVEIVDAKDVESSAKLIAEYILGGGLDA